MFPSTYFPRPYFPGTYFPGGPSPIAAGGPMPPQAFLLWFLRRPARPGRPIPTKTFLAALRTQLKAEPTLADLADVYLLRTPTNWSLPCLIVSPIRTTFEVTTKKTKLAYPEIQFTVLAEDDQQAWDLGEAAFVALDPDRPDGYLPVVFTDGVEAMRWPTYAQQFAIYPGKSKANKVISSYSFGYKFFVTR